MSQSLFIYFKISWICGLDACAISYWLDDDMKLFLLMFLVILNGIANAIFIVFQAIMICFFPENREMFLKTILLLTVNFPFIMAYSFLICIIFNL